MSPQLKSEGDEHLGQPLTSNVHTDQSVDRHSAAHQLAHFYCNLSLLFLASFTGNLPLAHHQKPNKLWEEQVCQPLEI